VGEGKRVWEYYGIIREWTIAIRLQSC